MEYYVKSLGQVIGDREQFQINGTTYPSGWLATASDEERANVEALPVDEVKPVLTETQAYGEAVVTVEATRAVRTYPVRDKTPDELAADKATYNWPLLQEIQELEQQQIRPQGEILEALIAGTAPNQFAVNKLRQINDAKAALRSKLK